LLGRVVRRRVGGLGAALRGLVVDGKVEGADLLVEVGDDTMACGTCQGATAGSCKCELRSCVAHGGVVP
jgi:hypothetical protein